jgi:ubiquitin-conjugating enzyme E2 D
MAKRLQKELKALGQTPLDFATASPVGDNLLHWNAMLEGPADSPYVNGVFSIDLVFPAEYPFKPPKVQFKTKIFHPQVNQEDGNICLGLAEEW